MAQRVVHKRSDNDEYKLENFLMSLGKSFGSCPSSKRFVVIMFWKIFIPLFRNKLVNF